MELDLVTTILVILGLVAGVVRDIARAQHEDSEFDWMAYLGERPLQVAGRLAIAIALLGPGGEAIAAELLKGGQAIPPEVAAVPAPFLASFFGDRVVKKVFEIGENVLDRVPGISTIIRIGKKLS